MSAFVVPSFPLLALRLLLPFLAQTSLVIPEDSGYSVFASTQWTQMTQAAVAAVLGIKDNRQGVCNGPKKP